MSLFFWCSTFASQKRSPVGSHNRKILVSLRLQGFFLLSKVQALYALSGAEQSWSAAGNGSSSAGAAASAQTNKRRGEGPDWALRPCAVMGLLYSWSLPSSMA